MKKIVVWMLVGAFSILIVGKALAMSDVERAEFLARMDKYAMQVQGEIQRRHELNLEIAKHQVALDLERAGADQTYIVSNSYSVSSSDNRVRNTNNVRGEIRNNADIQMRQQ